MTFTSDDINFIIYRYLHESGFVHSAYTFANESRVLESGAACADVPMGALINIVQKGVYYTEAETCAVASTSTASDSRTEKIAIENLSLLEAVSNELSSTNSNNRVKEEVPDDRASSTNQTLKDEKLQQQIRDREMRDLHMEKQICTNSKGKEPKASSNTQMQSLLLFGGAGASMPSSSATSPMLNNNSGSVTPQLQHVHASVQQPHVKQLHHIVDREREPRETRERILNGQVGKAKVAAAELRAAQANNGLVNGAQMEVDGVTKCRVNNGNGVLSSAQIENKPYEISRDKVRYLKGHDSEVFICTWNPKNDLIASGSGDSTARIWNVHGSEIATTSSQYIQQNSLVLKHCIQKDDKINPPNNKDVTSLDWNVRF